jgi:uncharacterized protein (DUF1778 family)
MPRPRPPRSRAKTPVVRPLMVRLDKESKAYLSQAAEMHGISLSDYVRTVAVAQARRELLASLEQTQTLTLTAEEQLAFWNALAEPPKLTEAQRRLGAIMRGES